MPPVGSPYNTARWQRLRAFVRSRDGNACVLCGSTQRLEVDHIVRPEDGGSMWDPENLRTLCGLHHRRKTASHAAARRRGVTPKPMFRTSRRW